MTRSDLAAVVRRLFPWRVRTRLAVLYAVLFLLAGAALLTITYLLVANALLPPASTKSIAPRLQALLGLCKQRQAPGQPAMSVAFVAKCNRAFAAAGGGAESQRDSELVALRSASAIGMGIPAIVSTGLGWLVSGRTLRPVQSITEAARRASELRLGQRLALTGPDDEFKQLADTFDVMLERLDAAFTSQKRFVANAAHELRTPLTAMRTAMEVTLSTPTPTPERLKAMTALIKQSIERAEATLEALLTLATSELGPTAQDSLDLATAAEDALDATNAAIHEREITVEVAFEPALARGDRVLLERMIANLVDNAIRHNSPKGWIRIRTHQQANCALFETANTGPCIPPAQIPILFEPFARINQRLNPTDGVGLGLSIAHTIATAHNATIEARPRSSGGLEVSVTIPTNPT